MTQTGILLTTLACMLLGQVGYLIGYIFDPEEAFMTTYTFMVSMSEVSKQNENLQKQLLKELL